MKKHTKKRRDSQGKIAKTEDLIKICKTKAPTTPRNVLRNPKKGKQKSNRGDHSLKGAKCSKKGRVKLPKSVRKIPGLAILEIVANGSEDLKRGFYLGIGFNFIARETFKAIWRRGEK